MYNAPDVVLYISPTGSGGGGGGGFPPSWANLAAGGTLTVAGGATTTYVAVDGTGAANTLNFPSSANAVDGQVVILSITSQQAQPNLTVNFGTGNAATDPNNPGNIIAANATAVIRNQGGIYAYKYRKATVAPWATGGWVQFE